MKIAAAFLWIIVPLGVWFAIWAWGTPHIVGSYTFYDNGDRYNPLAPRIYTTCTYHGWTGTLRVAAQDGRCPWFRFFRAEGV